MGRKRQHSSPSIREVALGAWECSPRAAVAMVLLAILFVALIRIRLRDTPLERDEGEYAYAGQLILQAIPPYQLAYNMKLPGTYVAYAMIMAVFGQTPAGIHLGLILVNALTIWLMYLLGESLIGRTGGVVAAVSHALLSASAAMMALQAHATHFVMLFAVAGLYALLKGLKLDSLLWISGSGLLFGLSFLMKQPGILFGVFGGLYLLLKTWTRPVPWNALLSRSTMFAAGEYFPTSLSAPGCGTAEHSRSSGSGPCNMRGNTARS